MVVDTKEVTLAGGASETVTFTTTRDVPGTYIVTVDSLSGTFRVKAPPPPPPARPAAFVSSDLSITPAEVAIGETVTISILVTNTGDLEGTYQATLKIDDVVVDTKEVTLAGGASETVTFTTTRDVPGTYIVTVDSLSGTFRVKAPPPPPPARPAAFVSSDLSITPAEVAIGETVTISILVTNTGDLEGTYQATLKIDNVVVDTKEVTLAGGDSETVTFTVSKDVAGTYTVTVDSLSGKFNVKAPFNWWLVIGPVIGLIIIIGVIVWLVIRRRRA